MIEVRWTPQAADDLQAIYDFIELDSPHYAQVIVEELFSPLCVAAQTSVLQGDQITADSETDSVQVQWKGSEAKCQRT